MCRYDHLERLTAQEAQALPYFDCVRDGGSGKQQTDNITAASLQMTANAAGV